MTNDYILINIPQCSTTMQLFIQGAETHCVTVDPTTTLLQLKETLSHQIPVEEQVITHAGNLLTDNAVLSECVADNSTLCLTGRLLGGKVHGSLARAGKVKGQTPKVAKMEDKKKKKTGRCKRRIQYNRRFSTAVSQFGRKKGPNSNSA